MLSGKQVYICGRGSHPIKPRSGYTLSEADNGNRSPYPRLTKRSRPVRGNYPQNWTSNGPAYHSLWLTPRLVIFQNVCFVLSRWETKGDTKIKQYPGAKVESTQPRSFGTNWEMDRNTACIVFCRHRFHYHRRVLFRVWCDRQYNHNNDTNTTKYQ